MLGVRNSSNAVYTHMFDIMCEFAGYVNIPNKNVRNKADD